MAVRSLDFRFARRPRWIAGHLIAVIAMVSFVNLGLWQLRRLDERQALNATITERLSEDAAPLGELRLTSGRDAEAFEYRRVTVRGVFLTNEEVILQARSHNGRSGHHLLTPMKIDDDTAIIVNRGWVPIDVAGPPVFEAAPPLGQLVATGWLRPTEQKGRFGPSDPQDGFLTRISRVDLDRLAEQISVPLLPVYLVLESPRPPDSSLPIPLATPEPSQGPHLGYAVQWFLFAVIVAIGYPVLLMRTASHSKGGESEGNQIVRPAEAGH